MKGWVGVAGMCLAAPAFSTPTPAVEAAVVRWLGTHGNRLSGTEPTVVDLAPIVKTLAGARVIGLGEVTHGTHEDVAFKSMLVGELVKAGAVDVVVIEANRVVGTGFDRYVRDGLGDPAALLMSPSAFKMLKNDEFAVLLVWLRAWNLAHPDRKIGVVAIDDQDGAVDANFALQFVARHDASQATQLRRAFGAMLPPMDGPRLKPSDWIAKHDRAEVIHLLAAAAALRDAIRNSNSDWQSDPEFAAADYAARITWQNFHIFEFDVAGADLTKTSAAYQSRRDRYMADNLIELLGTKRGALWAHNAHVMHTFPIACTKAGYVSLGVELKRRLGSDYRTLGATYTDATVMASRGDIQNFAQRTANQPDEPIKLSNTGPNTSGTPLSRLNGNAWWFAPAEGAPQHDLKRWMSKPLWNGETGWINDPVTFQRGRVDEEGAPFGMGYDILVWFRKLTPQHRWPVAKAPNSP